MLKSTSRPGDQRFFVYSGPFTLAELFYDMDVEIVIPPGAGRTPENWSVHDAAPLQNAGPTDISFFDNRRYLPLLKSTQAGVVVISAECMGSLPDSAVAVISREPYLTWARILNRFYPNPAFEPGIHPAAVVDPSAIIGADACIEAGAVIGRGAEIGKGTFIGPLCYIGANVVVGERCYISAHVTISHACLGRGVRILPGVRIGQEGFGFASNAKEGFVSVPQLGRVIIEDDVEIGANTTIDRGSVQDTLIGSGTRIDNLVQIGHNVQTGRCCVVVAQSGISGSTILEDFVTIAAQAGLTGHLRIGQGAQIGAQAGVMNHVPAGAQLLGSPAMPSREMLRNVAFLRRMARKKI